MMETRSETLQCCNEGGSDGEVTPPLRRTLFTIFSPDGVSSAPCHLNCLVYGVVALTSSPSHSQATEQPCPDPHNPASATKQTNTSFLSVCEISMDTPESMFTGGITDCLQGWEEGDSVVDFNLSPDVASVREECRQHKAELEAALHQFEREHLCG